MMVGKGDLDENREGDGGEVLISMVVVASLLWVGENVLREMTFTGYRVQIYQYPDGTYIPCNIYIYSIIINI